MCGRPRGLNKRCRATHRGNFLGREGAQAAEGLEAADPGGAKLGDTRICAALQRGLDLVIRD